MKRIAIIVMLGSTLVAGHADAKGCIKGALVGGAAGHLVHHGMLGAVGGCVVGMRRAHNRQRMQMQQDEQPPIPDHQAQPSTL